ncbi:MAG: hypothetical protein V8S27_09785 [Lachnospiraceae bacterium]
MPCCTCCCSNSGSPTSIVTIVQAFGTQRMAKEHAIIKKLSAVESLGAICCDLLRQNRNADPE